MGDEASKADEQSLEEGQERQHLLAVVKERSAWLSRLQQECACLEAQLQGLANPGPEISVTATLQAEIERVKGELAEAQLKRKEKEAAIVQEIRALDKQISDLDEQISRSKAHPSR